MLLCGACYISVECDFEDGMCDFKHESTSDFYWVRKRGVTATSQTGPAADHTLETLQGIK